MKWFLFFLLFCRLNLLFSQQIPQYIYVEKSEFKIVTGMCLVGTGLSIQPYLLRSNLRPFYHYPEFTIPVSLGLSMTISGIFDGIKKEKKIREITKN